MILFAILVVALTSCQDLKCQDYQYSAGAHPYETNDPETWQTSDVWTSLPEQGQGW